ncbi:MAG: glycosyltransferase, partial [Brevinematales bacterium]|nr:glycosyltransferase [Brevinematales bacterium]
MKCLIVFSGNTISGAEYVLQNYLRNTKYTNTEFLAICPDSKTKEFLVNSGLNPKNIFMSPFLLQLGVKKSKSFLKVLLLLTKIVLVMIGRITVQILSMLKKVDVILGKNTYDCLYMPFINGKKKVVLHIHDILDNSFMSNYIRKIIQKRINTVIAVSNEVKKSLGEKLKDKVVVIYNGIETSNIHRQGDYENKLVWIGSLEGRKNPLEFVEIIQNLVQNGVKIKGVMVYKYYEEEYSRIIQDAVKDKDYIEIKHNIPRHSVIEEIKKSLALVITSKVDPLPTVILLSLI